MLPSSSSPTVTTPAPRRAPLVPRSLRNRSAAPRPGAAAGSPRLAWLDALRGYAALVVTVFHLMPYLLGGVPAVLSAWLSVGRYGVLVFFLVSGYVIPMSLERYGDLRRFWLGRIFRIYPAWLLAVVLAGLAIAVLDHRSVPAGLAAQPLAGTLAHLTMLQELLGVPSLIVVFWTLSYEMVFYLLMSALFVFGLHRRVVACALCFAAAALLGGRLLPDDMLTVGRPGLLPVAVATAVLVAGSVLAYLTGRRVAVLVAAVAGLAVIALPALNGAADEHSHARGSWQALTFLALMFAGGVIHAAQHGRLRRRAAALTLGAVTACLLLAAWLHTPRPGQSAEAADRARIVAVGTLLAVIVTFAVAYALRHRHLPGWATWLGRISYSVYLLHPLVLWVFADPLRDARQLPLPVKVVVTLGYLAVVLVVASLAYRWVERPGQDWGRRVARAVDRRRARA